MIVCRQCGQAAGEGADFCASCGAFLAWQGDRVSGGEQPGPGTGVPPAATGAATPPPPDAREAWQGDRVSGGEQPGPGTGVPPAATGAATPPSPGTGDAGRTGERGGSVICLECGARNDGDRRFCRRCGATLDLVALTRRAPVPAPAPRPEVPDGPPDPADATVAGGLVARPPTAPVPAPPSRVEARPPTGLPPAVPEPVAVKGMQPAETRFRPAPARAVRAEREIDPGGPDCPECATTNPPGRRFCRKCGHLLAAATPEPVEALAPAPRLAWWRRLLARFRPGGRGEGGVSAGRAARAAYRRSLDLRFRVFRVLSVVAGVGVLAGSFGLVGVNPYTGARNLWDRMFPRDRRIGELVATVSPERAVEDDFAPGAAVDGDPATAWATSWLLDADAPAVEGCETLPAAAGGDGVVTSPGGGAAALVVTLPQVSEVSKLSVQPGLEAGDPARATQWRPTRLEVRFDDGTCTELELDDEAGFQDLRLDGPETRTLSIAVLDAAPPRDPDASRGLVALGEVRVFRPR